MSTDPKDFSEVASTLKTKRPQPCCYASATPLRAMLDGVYPPMLFVAGLVDRARALGIELDDFDLPETNVIVHQVDAHSENIETVKTFVRHARVMMASKVKPMPELGPCVGCGQGEAEGTRRRSFTREGKVLCSKCFTLPEFAEIVVTDVKESLGLDRDPDVSGSVKVVPIQPGETFVDVVKRVIGEKCNSLDAHDCDAVHDVLDKIDKGTFGFPPDARVALEHVAAEHGVKREMIDPPLNDGQLLYAIHRVCEHGAPPDVAVKEAASGFKHPTVH